MTLSKRGLDRIRTGNALLDEQDVRNIRRADAEGTATRHELARLYKVGYATISRVCRGETYGWIDGDVNPVRGGVVISQSELGESQERMKKLLDEMKK